MADSQITIRLRNKLVKIHESRRRNKTVIYLREMIGRHTKTDPSAVSLSTKLNEYLLANTTNRYKPITLALSKSEGFVKASLPGESKAQEKKAVDEKALKVTVPKASSQPAAVKEEKAAPATKEPKQEAKAEAQSESKAKPAKPVQKQPKAPEAKEPAKEKQAPSSKPSA